MTSAFPTTDGLKYIDTHCHIDLYPDPRAVMDEAQAAQVGVVAVTNTPSVFAPMAQLAEPFSNVFVAVGLHPELAAERESEVRLLPELMNKTEFVGEVGLDGTSADARTAAAQRRVFATVLQSAGARGPKVLTVHTRRAVKDTFALIGKEHPGSVILHWFTGTPSQMKDASERGWWFSVNPAMIATATGRTLLASMPAQSILTETDGPFTKVDGRPCRPTDVVAVVDYLAALWRCEHQEARNRVLDNFRRCATRPRTRETFAAWKDALLNDAPTDAPGTSVLSAITQLLQVDRELFMRDVNERAITARLGEHLRQYFPGWDVDCEYNRDGVDVKRSDIRNVVPDVIVHRRGTDDNLLVIEVKKSNSRESDDLDLEKLRSFRRPPLAYRAALFLKVIVGPAGPGVQVAQWI